MDDNETIDQWLRLCSWLRNVLKNRIDLIPYAFGVFFPGLWRGESNYAPVKMELLKKILGLQWYDQIYSDPKSIWLVPERFNIWKRNQIVQNTIADNLQFWLNGHLFNKLSAVGMAKILQASYDFEQLDLFRLLWNRAEQIKMEPDEHALLYQVY